MTPLVRFTVFAIVGVAGGYFSAQTVISEGFSGLTLNKGPWTAWSEAGTAETDPYTKAHFTARGVLPLSKFEALSFYTNTDSSGAQFHPECAYYIEGIPIPARTWSLTLVRKDGTPATNTSRRSSFNSHNVIRRSDESFTIVLSQSAQPGNWLPMHNETGFGLQFDIYNTYGEARNNPATIPVPIIKRGTCR